MLNTFTHERINSVIPLSKRSVNISFAGVDLTFKASKLTKFIENDSTNTRKLNLIPNYSSDDMEDYNIYEDYESEEEYTDADDFIYNCNSIDNTPAYIKFECLRNKRDKMFIELDGNAKNNDGNIY